MPGNVAGTSLNARARALAAPSSVSTLPSGMHTSASANIPLAATVTASTSANNVGLNGLAQDLSQSLNVSIEAGKSSSLEECLVCSDAKRDTVFKVNALFWLG